MSAAASLPLRRTDRVDRRSGPPGKRQPLAVRYIEAPSTHHMEAAGVEPPLKMKGGRRVGRDEES